MDAPDQLFHPTSTLARPARPEAPALAARLGPHARIVVAAVLAEAALVVIHVLNAVSVDLGLLNLNAEQNLPTWFSSGQFLLAGAACVAAFGLGAAHRVVWLALGALMLMLSLDEMAGLHEKVGASSGGAATSELVLQPLAAVAVIGLFAVAARRLGKPASWLVVLAGVSLVAGQGAESVPNLVALGPFVTAVVAVAGEWCEMLVGTFVLAAATVQVLDALHHRDPAVPSPARPVIRRARRRRTLTPDRVAIALVALAAVIGVAAVAFTSAGNGAPAPAAPAVVWAVADGADGGEDARALADRIGRGRVDRFLYAGDVYDDGTAEEFAENYDPVYGRFADRTVSTFGDHEWGNRAEGYHPYWQRRTGRPRPSYYVDRAGGWQIYSLNSEDDHRPGSAQVRWLRGELARSPGDCRLAIVHRPRFSAGTRHGDQPDVAPLWDALAGRAKLVLSGNDHDSQRLRPVNGITQLVVGAGGRSHYPIDDGDPRLAFGDDEEDAAVRMNLRPGLARVSFVAADGRVLDESRVSCRP